MQHGYVIDFDMRELFRIFVRELVDTSGESAAVFGKKSKISPVLLSYMKADSKTPRKGTWKQIELLVSQGIVTPSEVFERLHDLAQMKEGKLARATPPRLERETLRARLASAEISERGASAAREPQKAARPSPQGLSGRLQDRRTGEKG